MLIRINKFAELTGWTDRAVRRKIQEGVWLQGKEYHRAPDGNITIDMEGYERWVKGQRDAAAKKADEKEPSYG